MRKTPHDTQEAKDQWVKDYLIPYVNSFPSEYWFENPRMYRKLMRLYEQSIKRLRSKYDG